MKKIFTLWAALFLAATGFAQTTFTLERNGETLSNGAEITITEYSVEYDFSSMGMGICIKFDGGIHIRNNSGNAGKFVAKLEAIENCSNISICCGGTCIGVGTTGVVEKEGTLEAGATINTELHDMPTFQNTADISGHLSKCKLTVYAFGDEEDAVSVTLIMKGNTDSGLDQLKNSGKEVILTGRTLNYHFDNSTSHLLRLYDISGAAVMQQNLSSNSGTVSLEHLPQGIYIYKIEGTKACGKIIVK